MANVVLSSALAQQLEIAKLSHMAVLVLVVSDDPRTWSVIDWPVLPLSLIPNLGPRNPRESGSTGQDRCVCVFVCVCVCVCVCLCV